VFVDVIVVTATTAVIIYSVMTRKEDTKERRVLAMKTMTTMIPIVNLMTMTIRAEVEMMMMTTAMIVMETTTTVVVEMMMIMTTMTIVVKGMTTIL